MDHRDRVGSLGRHRGVRACNACQACQHGDAEVDQAVEADLRAGGDEGGNEEVGACAMEEVAVVVDLCDPDPLYGDLRGGEVVVVAVLRIFRGHRVCACVCVCRRSVHQHRP